MAFEGSGKEDFGGDVSDDSPQVFGHTLPNCRTKF